jgi:hypothetical protein
MVNRRRIRPPSESNSMANESWVLGDCIWALSPLGYFNFPKLMWGHKILIKIVGVIYK